MYVRSGAPLAAFMLSQQGRLERAAELAGRELAEQIIGRSVYAEENVFEIIAMLEALVALEDWDALVAFLPRARAFGDAPVLVEPAGDGAEGLARIASGDRVGGEKLLRRALAGFERLGVVFEAALTKERLAALGAAPHASRARAAGLEQATRH